MSRTSPAAAVSSQFCAATARSSGTFDGFLSAAGGVGDGSALPVTHPLSMTRRGLLALRRVHQRVLAQESKQPQHCADFGRLAAPSH